MEDSLNTSDSGRDDAFRSREELIEENARLREALRHQQQENDMLAGMLARCYEKMPELKGSERPAFPISDEAIDLFEALLETFSLDDALEVAELIGLEADEAIRHLRTYLEEEMVVQDTGRGRFIKTGRKPYF